MDAYTQFIIHDAAQPDDRDAEWLNEHERTCPKTMGGMSRDQGVPTMHHICPECKDLQRQLWGIHPIRTPQADVGDPDPHSTWDAALDEIKAWESKAALANIHTLHPERAA